jgi:hypothetical protein
VGAFSESVRPEASELPLAGRPTLAPPSTRAPSGSVLRGSGSRSVFANDANVVPPRSLGGLWRPLGGPGTSSTIGEARAADETAFCCPLGSPGTSSTRSGTPAGSPAISRWAALTPSCIARASPHRPSFSNASARSTTNATASDTPGTTLPSGGAAFVIAASIRRFTVSA